MSKEQPAAQWALPEALAPLQPHRTRMTLFEGLYNPHGTGLHGTYGSILNVQPSPGGDEQNIGGISIDRLIATQLESSLPFSSINFGYPYAVGDDRGNASADGESAPYPAMSDPVQIINQLFGGEQSNDNQEFLERQITQRLSVLDASIDDIERMRGRLAGEERAQMDQYLDSLRQLELQMIELLDAECVVPTWDDAGVPSGSSISAKLARFYYDAAALALECGLTHVVSVAWEGVGTEPGQPRHDFAPVDVSESLHDAVQHPLNGLNNDASDQAWADKEEHVAKIRRVYHWRSQLVADFMERLGQLDLGGHTTADRTLLLWVNAGGGRHHNGADQMPLMLLGNPDGVLRSGRYERFEEGTRCIGDAYTTAAHAMGLPIEGFGDPAHAKGPLPGSLA